MKEVTVKQAMLDLMNVFLCKLLAKPRWETQELANLFYKSMYEIALDYVSTLKEREEDNK